jgi:REP element-mobilizing transposase RayT
VTLRVRRGVPSLRSASFVAEWERSLARACERGEFRVVHYSVQTNHAHLVVEAHDRDALARGMKAVAARLARAANRVFRRRGPVLADRYHLRVLRTPREVRRVIAYVLLNARKHAAGGAGGVDPASSGRWFDGWRRAVRLASSRLLPAQPVANPRTWLLRIGWRRHGLIDPEELPGGW